MTPIAWVATGLTVLAIGWALGLVARALWRAINDQTYTPHVPYERPRRRRFNPLRRRGE